MRTITVALYQFNELSEKAKGQALQELYSVADYPWHDENQQLLKAIEKAFKLERFEWKYDAYSSCHSFRVPHDIKQGLNRKKLSLWLEYMERDNPFINGYCLTEDFVQWLWKYFDQYGDIKQALHDAIGSVVKACQEDMEYYFSEESLAEHATANGIEFTEDGILV